MADEVIEGMDDLIRSLDKLTFVQSQQVLAKSLKNASIILAEEQEHLVPQRTGKLAGNIRYQLTEKSASECISRIGPTRKVFYASFGNFGTRFQHGLHFIEQAWSNKKEEVWAVIHFDLGKFIDKAMKKNG